MTTAKTARELEHLVMAELREICPECAQIADVVVMPAYDYTRDDGAWRLATIIKDDGSTAASPSCKDYQVTVVSRLRQAFHLMEE